MISADVKANVKQQEIKRSGSSILKSFVSCTYKTWYAMYINFSFDFVRYSIQPSWVLSVTKKRVGVAGEWRVLLYLTCQIC